METVSGSASQRPVADRSALVRLLLPLCAGALIALLCSVLLEKAGWTWVFLVVAGLLAWIPPLILKEPRAYWLGVFLFILPFNLTKTFGSEARIRSVLETVGGVWGHSTLILQAADLALLVLLGDWLVRLATGKSSIRFPQIAFLPLLYLAWVTLGALFAAYPALSFFEIIREYKLFLIFLFTVNNVDVERLGKLIIPAILFGVLLQSGVTLVRYQTQQFTNVFGEAFGEFETSNEDLEQIEAGEESRSSDRKRGYGTFQHPNVTAMHLAFTLPLAFALFLQHRSSRWAGLAIFLLGVTALYLTFSRGGFLGLVAGLTIVIVVATLRKWVPPYLSWVGALVAILSLPLVIPTLQSYLRTRPDYFSQRLDHLQVGMRMIWLNPVMGTGLNNSTPYRASSTPGGVTWEETNLPLHSYHMLILIETGVVGFALYYGFFGIAAVRAYRLTGATDFCTSLMATGVLAGYGALAVHLTVDFLNLDALQMLLWFFTGLVVGRASNPRPASAAHSNKIVVNH